MNVEDLKLEKQLHSDIREALGKAIDGAYPNEYFYAVDFDDEYVYFGNYMAKYRLGYSLSDTMTVTLAGTDTREVVNKISEFVVSDDQSNVTKQLVDKVKKFFGKDKPEEVEKDLTVRKQFDDEAKTTTEFLYIHPDEVDGVGDTYTQEDANYMVESLNKANDEGRLQSGLFHKHKTNTFSVAKAYIAEEDCVLGVHEIKKGQPLVDITYTNASLYELRKEGKVMGPSIGARAKEIIELTDGVEKSLGEGEILLHKTSLDDLKSAPVAKRILKGIHFDWPNPELTLTDASQGGAASLKNDIIVEKAMKPNEDQQGILDELEEEFTPLAKAKGVDDSGTTKTTTNEGTEDMSEQIQKELAEVKHELAVQKAIGTLTPFKLGDELEAEVAKELASLEDSSAIIKALTAIVAMGDYGVAKALEDAKVAPTEDTPLAKALDQEAGDGGEAEAEVEKSFADQVKEAQDKLLNKGAA